MTMTNPLLAYQVDDTGSPYLAGEPRSSALPPKPKREPSPAEKRLHEALRAKLDELLVEPMSARTLRHVVAFSQHASLMILPFEGDDALIDAKLGSGNGLFNPVMGGMNSENYGTKVIHELVTGLKALMPAPKPPEPTETLTDLLESHKLAATAGHTDIAASIMLQIRARIGTPPTVESYLEPAIAPSVNGVPMVDNFVVVVGSGG